MAKPAKKLSDAFPKPHDMDVLHGKKIRIGVFTLDHLLWAEDKFGSFDAMQAEVFGEALKVGPVVSLLFQLTENKGDFNDERDFAAHIPVAAFGALRNILVAQASASMPLAEESGGTGEAAASGN